MGVAQITDLRSSLLARSLPEIGENEGRAAVAADWAADWAAG